MKKILLGLVAGLSLLAFTVPAHAEGDEKAPAEGKPAKKHKKAKKGGDDDKGGAPAAGDEGKK